MSKGTLKIHSENILPIIKKSLYSDKDIFIRELISNACDAISKLKILRDQQLASYKDEEIRIDITLDKEKKMLQFCDTGLGMTKEEVENYIAHLAFSGAEEFFKKYEKGGEKDQIIGHFGLGFYSSFMVSHTVEIDTKSYLDQEEAVHWTSDGSYEYEIDSGTRSSRGTDITLHIEKDSEEFLDERKVKDILQKYCSYLPYPIFFNGTQINDKQPLWLKNPSECTETEYLEFYRKMYPMDLDPIFWVHLNVDYPFHLKGILFFPKMSKRFDFHKSNIQLYCNRVFVSDNCKDLIPDHLMILKGAIDSPDIPLNVSRSYLQMDKTVRGVSTHITKKISDRLNSFYVSDKEKFHSIWPDIEMIIKFGCLNDDKFYDRVKDFLVWKTIQEEWTTAEEYQERHKEAYQNKIYYSTHEKQNSHFLQLYSEKNIEVLVASSSLDIPLMNLMESKNPSWRFQRIDSSIDDHLLDKSKEKTLLDPEGKTEAVKLAELIKKNLPNQEVEVEAKSLASPAIPGFVMLDEASRRMRDYMALSQPEMMAHFPSKQTFIVNTNNPLVMAIEKLSIKNPELSKMVTEQIYQLSLLGQRELKGDDLSGFIQKSNMLLQNLTIELTK